MRYAGIMGAMPEETIGILELMCVYSVETIDFPKFIQEVARVYAKEIIRRLFSIKNFS